MLSNGEVGGVREIRLSVVIFGVRLIVGSASCSKGVDACRYRTVIFVRQRAFASGSPSVICGKRANNGCFSFASNGVNRETLSQDSEQVGKAKELEAYDSTSFITATDDLLSAAE